MTDTPVILCRLQADGFTLRTEDGKLLVSPAARLTPALAAELRACKAELIAHLTANQYREALPASPECRQALLAWPDADPDWEAKLDALAERAWDDDPFAGDGPSVVLRESVLLHLDGWWLAVSADVPERVAAHNRWAAQRWARGGEARATQRPPREAEGAGPKAPAKRKGATRARKR